MHLLLMVLNCESPNQPFSVSLSLQLFLFSLVDTRNSCSPAAAMVNQTCWATLGINSAMSSVHHAVKCKLKNGMARDKAIFTVVCKMHNL